MAGEIIRKGDRTSHGGTVLEGSPSDICMGQPIAYIGHKTYCPKCKGNFPIVEGMVTTTFYGKGVAVAGMKTSCGATLIAGQFTDIVEWNSGSNSSAPRIPRGDLLGDSLDDTRQNKIADDRSSEDDESIEIEHYYTLCDSNGNSLSHYRYDLYIDEILQARRSSYTNGRSTVITGDVQSRLVTWMDRDSAERA